MVAAATVLVSFQATGYGLGGHAALAIAAWSVVLMLLGLRLTAHSRVPRSAWAAGGLLALFAATAGLSSLWATSAELAFDEFDTVGLYLGVFVLVVLGARRGEADRWADGLAAGLAVVALIALASRFFPSLAPQPALPGLSNASLRLSYPVGYWNSLAILVALAVPLLVRAGVLARSGWARGLAVAPIPAVAAVVFLASSRGAVAVAAVGAIALLALGRRRVAVAWIGLLGAVGSAGAIAIVHARPALVHGPLRSAAAGTQGLEAALLVAGICVLVGVAHVLVSRTGLLRASVPRRVGIAVVAVTVALVAVGVAALDPVTSFDHFRRAPVSPGHRQSVELTNHLLNTSGSGRWQFWQAAIGEFESAPLVGRGGGSYEAWWAQHGSLPLFARNTHSLYLETLGELGLLGFVLLVAGLVVSLVTGVARLRRRYGRESFTAAALVATFLAFLVGVGIDWVWQFASVAGAGIACAALLTGPATLPRALARSEPVSRRRGPRDRRRAYALGTAVVAAAWVLICCEAIPWLAQHELAASQQAARQDHINAATDKAQAARSLAPWASSPYVQLALLREQTGDVGAARRWLDAAVQRDRDDWRLWLISARLNTKLGAIPAARQSLERARELNPRLPLLARSG